MAAEKKKIDVKQFLRDVETGMHDTSLMAKYALSPGELQRVLKRLEEKGLLKQPPPSLSSPAPAAAQQPRFECPSCGAVHTQPFDECPNCGIVVSKLRDQGASSEPYRERDGKPQSTAYAYPSSPVFEVKYFFKIVGVVVVVAVVVGGFLTYRWIKAFQNQALAKNVQAVLTASNAAAKPNYRRLAQIFGDATGAMAAVMESRKTPLNEKMHELYQKLFYLGELQTKLSFRQPGVPSGAGAYPRAIGAAEQSKRTLGNELDSVREGLTSEQRSLNSAGDEESPASSSNPPIGSSAMHKSKEGNDTTAAHFARAEEELRSLCEQVLQMLAVR
jgi:hypothetical protein